MTVPLLHAELGAYSVKAIWRILGVSLKLHFQTFIGLER